MPSVPPLPTTLRVSACVMSLASNVKPDEYLVWAHDRLKQLGDMVISEPYHSPIVMNTIAKYPTYVNQVAFVEFQQPLEYQALFMLTKQLEQQASREQYQKPLVTLDIDIVAVKLLQASLSNVTDEKGETFVTFADLPQWLGIARRFPLTSYDQHGIVALAQHTGFYYLKKLV